jgi:hypothetical protein
MSQPAVRLFSYAESLDIDRASPLKHAYIDGIGTAMGGGSMAHSLPGAAVVGELRDLLTGSGCRVHASDQPFRILPLRPRVLTGRGRVLRPARPGRGRPRGPRRRDGAGRGPLPPSETHDRGLTVDPISGGVEVERLTRRPLA